jgi:hypothetical protein
MDKGKRSKHYQASKCWYRVYPHYCLGTCKSYGQYSTRHGRSGGYACCARQRLYHKRDRLACCRAISVHFDSERNQLYKVS